MRARKQDGRIALTRAPRLITVLSMPGRRQRGVLRCAGLLVPCALGRGGLTHMKREGDGATPAGRYRLVSLYARRDRRPGPRTGLPLRATRPDDGWCDDPADGRYNRPLRLSVRASHEEMWREDRLYDRVGVLDWNLRPRICRLGSAIFVHLCQPDFAPTAGCIALRSADLERVLAAAGTRPEFLVGAKPRKGRRRR